MAVVERSRVKFVLLYRAEPEWRITVGTSDELACGALPRTVASEPFEQAAEEFAAMLQTQWAVEGPISWEQIKPGSWGADLVPGALAAAGERPS
jgi:hypothetical protein